MEIYYAVLRDFGEVPGEKAFSATAKYAIEFGQDDVKNAMRNRLELRRKKKLNLSYCDALGYTLAARLRVEFLTGDNAFKGLDNVEFVN